MHLINIRVAYDDDLATMKFFGEGSEHISVTFGESPNDLAEFDAVADAKPLMNPLTIIDDNTRDRVRGSINRYDAQSNGNFDEPSHGLEPIPSAVRSTASSC